MAFRVLMLMALAPLAAQAATPVSSADQPETAAGKQDKIICKRFARLGSLVETEKVCRTKRDWENTRANLVARGPTGACAGAGGPDSAQSGSSCGIGY